MRFYFSSSADLKFTVNLLFSSSKFALSSCLSASSSVSQVASPGITLWSINKPYSLIISSVNWLWSWSFVFLLMCCFNRCMKVFRNAFISADSVEVKWSFSLFWERISDCFIDVYVFELRPNPIHYFLSIF